MGTLCGTLSAVGNGGGGDPYTGEYTVTPTFADQTLETQGLYMLDDVTVEAIEVSRTTNPSGGTTVYIGGIN